jgi:hypothetical protein
VSVDINLYDQDGDEVFQDNYTYNIGPMFHSIFGESLRDLIEGQRAGDTLVDLVTGYTTMNDYIDVYRKMNPSNGWGSADGGRDLLRRLSVAAIKYPDLVWECN